MNRALAWRTFAYACDAIARNLQKLGHEADSERLGNHAEDVQAIFKAVKKAQLEADHAVLLANSLAAKIRAAK